MAVVKGCRIEQTSHHLFRMSFVVHLRKTVISRRQRQTMALNINVSVVANKYCNCTSIISTNKWHIFYCDHTVYSKQFSKKQENYQQFYIFTNICSQLQFSEICILSSETNSEYHFFSLEFTFFCRITVTMVSYNLHNVH